MFCCPMYDSVCSCQPKTARGFLLWLGTKIRVLSELRSIVEKSSFCFTTKARLLNEIISGGNLQVPSTMYSVLHCTMITCSNSRND